MGEVGEQVGPPGQGDAQVFGTAHVHGHLEAPGVGGRDEGSDGGPVELRGRARQVVDDDLDVVGTPGNGGGHGSLGIVRSVDLDDQLLDQAAQHGR